MKFGRRMEPAGPKNMNWSSLTSVLKGCPSSSRQRAEDGRCRWDRPPRPRGCAHRLPRLFQNDDRGSGSTCFRRIAAARPAGPAPTITTSNSIASRSGSSIASVILSSHIAGPIRLLLYPLTGIVGASPAPDKSHPRHRIYQRLSSQSRTPLSSFYSGKTCRTPVNCQTT